MSFLNPSADFVRRRRWLIGGASVLATAAIGAGFWVGQDANRMRPDPTIIYVDNWAANRSRDDTLTARAQDKAQLAARLAESRAYIASLPPEKRKAAQADYDRYVAARPKDRVS